MTLQETIDKARALGQAADDFARTNARHAPAPVQKLVALAYLAGAKWAMENREDRPKCAS